MNIRIVNNYRIVYQPGHQNAMKSENWNGWVYEHIYVVTKFLGRSLECNEVVHHLDGNTMNNRNENLLVLDRGQHTKLHGWMRRGAPYGKPCGENSVNCGEPSGFCQECKITLQEKQSKFCSTSCYGAYQQRERGNACPSKQDLISELVAYPVIRVARLHNVSDSAIRKWCKKLGIDCKAIRSQARESSGSNEKVQRLGSENAINNLPLTPNTLTHNGEGDEIVQGGGKPPQT